MAKFQSTRPVWGATAMPSRFTTLFLIFQSTRPVWGATHMTGCLHGIRMISIHAPRVGRDNLIMSS